MQLQYTDEQLKQTLAKMLPEIIWYNENSDELLHVNEHEYIIPEILDTELLYLCWLVEETVSSVDSIFKKREYIFELMKQCNISPDMGGKWSFVQDFALLHTTWQQRTVALAKVKEIEIEIEIV